MRNAYAFQLKLWPGFRQSQPWWCHPCGVSVNCILATDLIKKRSRATRGAVISRGRSNDSKKKIIISLVCSANRLWKVHGDDAGAWTRGTARRFSAPPICRRIPSALKRRQERVSQRKRSEPLTFHFDSGLFIDLVLGGVFNQVHCHYGTAIVPVPSPTSVPKRRGKESIFVFFGWRF